MSGRRLQRVGGGSAGLVPGTRGAAAALASEHAERFHCGGEAPALAIGQRAGARQAVELIEDRGGGCLGARAVGVTLDHREHGRLGQRAAEQRVTDGIGLDRARGAGDDGRGRDVAVEDEQLAADRDTVERQRVAVG